MTPWKFTHSVPAGDSRAVADAIVRAMAPASEQLAEAISAGCEQSAHAALDTLTILRFMLTAAGAGHAPGGPDRPVSITGPLALWREIAANGVAYHREWIARTEDQHVSDLLQEACSLAHFADLAEALDEVADKLAQADQGEREAQQRRARLHVVGRPPQHMEGTA